LSGNLAKRAADAGEEVGALEEMLEALEALRGECSQFMGVLEQEH